MNVQDPPKRVRDPRARGLRGGVAVIAFALMTAGLGIAPAVADHGGSILIYGPSLDEDAAINEQTLAEAAHHTVTVWDTETWSEANTAAFAAFDAIVFGDPSCSFGDTTPLATAEANRATWSAAVSGPMIIIGTDPIFHVNNGVEAAGTLTTNAINFAASGSGTGLYASLSCYYESAPPDTTVELLGGFAGAFRVQAQTTDPVTIEDDTHPSMTGLTTGTLSGWGVSVHEVFNAFPEYLNRIVRENGTALPYIIATSGGGPAEGADLSLTKSDAPPFGPEPVSSGGRVAYRISVSNGGPDAATGVQVVDSATGGTVVRAIGTGWSCSIEGNTATCDLAGSLASDTSAPDLTVEVQAPTTSTDSMIIDSATVSANEVDPDSGDNSDTEDTTVRGTSNPASRDQAQAFYDGTQQVTVATTRDTVGGFYSQIVVPPGLSPGVVSINERPASEFPTFCGGARCLKQVQISVLPEGTTSATNPIHVFFFFPPPGEDRGEGKLYVKGDNETVASVVPKCVQKGVANPAKCLTAKKKLPNGDFRWEMLWRDGGDPIGGKRR